MLKYLAILICVLSSSVASAATVIVGLPLANNDEGVTSDLLDVAQGTIVTSSSSMFSGYDARSALGFIKPQINEPSRAIFSDNPVAIDFIAFQTPQPINLSSYNLILGEDIGTSARSAKAIRLYASNNSGDVLSHLISNTSITQTYVNAYGSANIGISDAVNVQNVQFFRLEIERTRTAGFSGPRVIELDGFGTVVPEPPAFTLFVLGLAGLGLWRHRKVLFQMKRLAICLLILLTPSIVAADTYRNVDLEIAGSKWGHLLLNTTAGTIVDSDLQMPGNYGTPDSPNGWNNFTHVSGPLSWETVGDDLARIRLPERVVSTIHWSDGGMSYCQMLWTGSFQAAACWGLIPSMNWVP